MDPKAALTCIVPSDPSIQTLRQAHDTAFERWPPHFNIDCFPFYPAEAHEEWAPKIQRVCADLEPLALALNSVAHFPASKRKPGTLYAEVTEADGGSNGLRAMYDAVQRAVAPDAAPGQAQAASRAFTPHVTLGRFEKQEALAAAQESAAAAWAPLHFTLTGLTLIVRGPSTPFRAVYRFPFGADAFERVDEPYFATEEAAAAAAEKAAAAAAREVDELFAVQVTQLCDHYVFRVSQKAEKAAEAAAAEKAKKRPAIKNVLLIDNSASMGSMTCDSTKIIGGGLFSMGEQVATVPGAVVIFANSAEVLSGKVQSAADVAALKFPRQGGTNITAGVKMAVDVCTAEGDPSVHYMITFLSDGAHNTGPRLSDADIATMRAAVDACGMSLSINVVGLCSPDTSLGMRVKTGLETVSLEAMESVYYARSQGELQGVLGQLTEGCVGSVSKGAPVTAAVEGGVFAESKVATAKVHVQDGETVLVVQREDGGCGPPQLVLDGRVVKATELAPQPSDVTLVVESLVPKLSRMKIAHGTDRIRALVMELETLTDKADALFKKLSAGDGADVGVPQRAMVAKERLRLLQKKRRAEQSQFGEARNKLQRLLATVSNDSQAQAEYLSGIGKKYAAKAVLRAGTDTVTPAEAYAKVAALKERLEAALAAATARRAEAAAAGTAQQEEQQSLLSLCSAPEQLEEWAGALETLPVESFNDLYSVLAVFGFAAHPVAFDHNNAVQMDPFQTQCTFVEPCLVDTPSLMLANQVGHEVTTQSRAVVTDGLVLVSPSCPEASLLAMRSVVNQHLSSVTLCRDLYMYHPKMTFAMHAHAFVRAAAEHGRTGSSAYLELCLRILYSMRKVWGEQRCAEGDNVALFRRWWAEWAGITQGEEDACSHPVQLVLMLGVFDLGTLGVPRGAAAEVLPFTNLVNEMLARVMKAKLRGAYAGQDDETIHHRAVQLMQGLMGVRAGNSPRPLEDVMAEEPTLVSVRESCQRWADVDADADAVDTLRLGDAGVAAFVEETLAPMARAFGVAAALQRHLEAGGRTWAEHLVPEIEREGGIPEALLKGVAAELAAEGAPSVARRGDGDEP